MRNTDPRRPVAVVAIITALCLLGDSMLYVVLPIYYQEAGLSSLWEVGVLLAVNRFVRLPLNPLAGWLYEKFPLRTGLTLAVLLGSCTTLGYGLCRGFWAWLLLRCLWGLAWSLLRMGGFATVVRYSDATNRGQLIGMYNGLYRLGSLFGMLFGGLLAPWIGLSRLALGMGGISLAGLAFVTGHAFRKQHTGGNRPQGHAVTLPWNSTVTKIILSGFGTAMLFQGLLTATLSYVILNHRGPVLPLWGLSIGAATLSGILLGARWVWEPFVADICGRWSDGPRGRIPLLTASLLGAGIGFLLIPWPLPLGLWIVAVVWVLLTATSLTTLVDALAADVAKQSTLAVMTVHSIALDLGAALGPILGYWFIGFANGLSLTYTSGGVLMLLLCGWWGLDLVRRKGQKQKCGPSP